MPWSRPKYLILPLVFTALLILGSCSLINRKEPAAETSLGAPVNQPTAEVTLSGSKERETSPTETAAFMTGSEEEIVSQAEKQFADVVSVAVSGLSNQYQFSVGISSPDTGCKQYADWWEILSEDGDLIYRRILIHSHVNEQPFTRSGGPIDIEKDTVVYIRAHMNPAGYGGLSMKGTVDTGFSPLDSPANFSPGIEQKPPLPAGCNF